METTSVDGQLFTAFFKVQQLNVVLKKMEMITSTIDQIQIMPDFNQGVNKHWSAFPKVKGSSPEEFQEKTLSVFKVS